MIMKHTMDGLLGVLSALVAFSVVTEVSSCSGRTILRANGVSESEKQEILDAHNRMRQSVALGKVGGQPPASNMMEMKWDNELAARAQYWSSSCDSEDHDANRNIPRFPVGQNIATTWTTKPPETYEDINPDFTKAIGKWFNEYKDFSFGVIRRDRTGHYTQMLWAETNLVGCGFAYYHDEKGYTKNYVCNYGPSGNVIGVTPYKSGNPSCSNYGMGESSKYYGLCDDKVRNFFYSTSNYIG